MVNRLRYSSIIPMDWDFATFKVKKAILFCLFYCLVNLIATAQNKYRTVNDGLWGVVNTWDFSGVPPNPLPFGDSIFINHNIDYTVDQDVEGVMVIASNASLIGWGEGLFINGRGSINEGVLINYGIINIDNLEVKPMNGCDATDVLPVCHNYGLISMDNGMHIGNNCGSGGLYNYAGAKINVEGDLHLDGWICNQDSMFFSGVVKVHGGTLDCCGYIECEELDIDENPENRPGNMKCMNICTSTSIDPVLDAGGVQYNDVEDLYLGMDPIDAVMDDDSLCICNINSLGLPCNLDVPLNINDFAMSFSCGSKLYLDLDYDQSFSKVIIEGSFDNVNYEEIKVIHNLKAEVEDDWKYYRARLVLLEGKEVYYSNIIYPQCNNSDLKIRIRKFNHQLLLHNGSLDNEVYSIKMFNSLSRLVYERNILIEGEKSISLNLPSGIYYLVVESSQGQFKMMKIIW